MQGNYSRTRLSLIHWRNINIRNRRARGNRASAIHVTNAWARMCVTQYARDATPLHTRMGVRVAVTFHSRPLPFVSDRSISTGLNFNRTNIRPVTQIRAHRFEKLVTRKSKFENFSSENWKVLISIVERGGIETRASEVSLSR